MTDECLDIPTDIQGTVGESDAIDTPTNTNGVDDSPTADPVGGGRPTSALDQDAEARDEHDPAINPTAKPEETEAVHDGVHVPTSAWTEGAGNGSDQQKTGNAQRDETVLDVDVQRTSHCDSPTKSPLLTPELFNPGNISVEISGKSERENRDGDHVFSEYADSPSPNYFRGKVNTPASAFTDPQELLPYNDR